MKIFRAERMDESRIISDTLSRIQLGEETSYGGMTLFPLLGESIEVPDYLTLDEALARGEVRITEVSSAGSVPELALDNRSDDPVLLVDGEELIGAKQNRVLNLTILAPANRALTIPVSCVEAARWSRRSAAFTTSGYAYFARARATKTAQVSRSLGRTGRALSDQHRVWEDVAAKASRLEAQSTTAAMFDIYRRYAKTVDDYVAAFVPADRQAGAAFAISGAVVGLDLFDCAATWRKLMPKLIRSYALDAIEASEKNGETTPCQAVEELLSAAALADAKSFPAVGEGLDVRLEGPDLAGAGLLARGRVVHLSAFRTKGAPQSAA
ncbi:MAG TPA: DUF6569 family protein [candidate division Zixibacteria bacterium]|nr:DUF6569 family protein [candidate division Zixibacteria bacterium]